MVGLVGEELGLLLFFCSQAVADGLMGEELGLPFSLDDGDFFSGDFCSFSEVDGGNAVVVVVAAVSTGLFVRAVMVVEEVSVAAGEGASRFSGLELVVKRSSPFSSRTGRSLLRSSLRASCIALPPLQLPFNL